jgi:hypothetical protein
MSRSRDLAHELANLFHERLELDDGVERRVRVNWRPGANDRRQLRRNAIPGVVLGEFVGHNTELYEVD